MSAAATSELIPAEEPFAGNYFVAAYPPFSAWQPEQVGAVENVLRHPASAPAVPLGLYVHVPFCQKKCDYCYYLSHVDQKPEVVDQYLAAMVREMALFAAEPALRNRPASFVYFGGGTPSMLTSSQVRLLVEGLRAALPWDGVKEVTFECAPRSVRPELLQTLRDMGVTRLSMGVQSFDNLLLKLNGRVHLAQDALRAYELIQRARFDSVNLDLMVGLMSESWEQWRKSVRHVIELGPDSVTIYQTEIPHNTGLYQDLKAGFWLPSLVSWNEKRARLGYAFEELERAGYTVVSAYNAVKDPQRHRFLYQDYLWHGADLLGLGVASFGYFAGVHYQNAIELENYRSMVLHGFLPLKRAFRLSARDQMAREFILQLKLGVVSLAGLRARFGLEAARLFAVPLRQLAAEGFLTVSPEEVRLTRPGLLCVDRLLPLFYDPRFRDLRYT